tara:strand:+ start:164 stop:712 length:549 start_codon:yes stop_codon:yes gene_type:complete
MTYFNKLPQVMLVIFAFLIVTFSLKYWIDSIFEPQRLDCEDVDAMEYIYSPSPFENTSYTGYVKLCDSNGKVAMLCHYNDFTGELDGRCESYAENGDVLEVQGYKNGKQQYARHYESNGLLVQEYIYADGKHFCVKAFDFKTGKRTKPLSDWKECDGSCKYFVKDYEFKEYEFHDYDGNLIK